MINSGSGIEVITEGVENNPCCKHGPTLLFERYTSDGKKSGNRYYACSACRNRKECDFFQWAHSSKTSQKPHKWSDIMSTVCPAQTHKEQYRRLRLFKTLPVEKKRFCKTCCTLMIEEDEFKGHVSHDIVFLVQDDDLSSPSQLINSTTTNATKAQYYFSQRTVKVIVENIHRQEFDRVICIGTPRIHEYILRDCPKLFTLLMDIEQKYEHFFGPQRFCWYNMFNNHFFRGESARKVQQKFMKDATKCVVVIDPPFGGLVDAITSTLRKLSDAWDQLSEGSHPLSIIWIFPYFNEKRICTSLPSLKMLDFRVDYENHTTFSSGSKGRKKGSPVRLFTNIAPSLFKFPEEEYRFCTICQQYVHLQNKHCKQCDSCTSKDGGEYRHCTLCGRCVKVSYEHCKECGECRLKEHACGPVLAKCFACGGFGHKHRECPKKRSDVKCSKRKRKH